MLQEEAPMTLYRIVALASLFLLVLMGVQAPIASAVGCEFATQWPNEQGCVADLSDYFQRHPGMVNSTMNAELSDYYQRHRSVNNATLVAEISDYFQRHPSMAQTIASVETSDYYQRHPEIAMVLNGMPFPKQPSADVAVPQTVSSPGAWNGGWRSGH